MCFVLISLSRANRCAYDPTRQFSDSRFKACEKRVRLLREEMHTWYEDASTLLQEIEVRQRRAERLVRRPH